VQFHTLFGSFRLARRLLVYRTEHQQVHRFGHLKVANPGVHKMTRSQWNRRQWMGHVGAATTGLAASGFSGLAGAQKPISVGFIYVGPRDDYGYNQAHAEAVAMVKKMAGIKVVEEENVPETNAVQKTMQGMIAQDGATLLFPTSFGYFDPHMLAVASKSTDVRFAHCGGLWNAAKHPKNTGSFFGYIDEAQYLNGVVAGHVSKSKKLGFVAAKPIPQVLRNINAFTMGARSVNPGITTTVIFTGDWSMPVKEAEATNSLADQGVDVFTMHVDGPKVIVETAAKRGKFVCGYHASQAKLAPQAYLTGAEWNWVSAYQQIIDAARTGKPHPNFVRGGLKDGFVKSSPYGPSVPEAARKQAEAVRASMLKGAFDIFKGELKDNSGKVVIAAGKVLKQTDLELENMNYLVEGVVGKV
jgi:basic membrane protein A and related proteins